MLPGRGGVDRLILLWSPLAQGSRFCWICLVCATACVFPLCWSRHGTQPHLSVATCTRTHTQVHSFHTHSQLSWESGKKAGGFPHWHSVIMAPLDVRFPDSQNPVSHTARKSPFFSAPRTLCSSPGLSISAFSCVSVTLNTQDVSVSGLTASSSSRFPSAHRFFIVGCQSLLSQMLIIGVGREYGGQREGQDYLLIP